MNEKDIQGYYTLRRDVMNLADALTGRRSELLETVSEINKGITVLVELADRLLGKALSELTPSGDLKSGYGVKAPSPKDIAAHTNPQQHHCSNCGESGHTVRTCTNPRKGEPEATEKQKTRKKRVMTEEQRAECRKRMAKVRATRGKK